MDINLHFWRNGTESNKKKEKSRRKNDDDDDDDNGKMKRSGKYEKKKKFHTNNQVQISRWVRAIKSSILVYLSL